MEGPGIAAAASFPCGPIMPGEIWNFQGYYRDPAGPCGAGFNFSNSLYP